MNTNQVSGGQIPDDWVPAGEGTFFKYVRRGPADIDVEVYRLNEDGIVELSHTVPCRVIPSEYLQ
jgi:hypothetical protein